VPRILVVEDSSEQQALITALLEGEGYEVATAGDGRRGLDAMAADKPDLVLTDLNMPGMDGLELVEAVAGEGCTVPIVLMTAFGSEEIAARALARGASSYIPKSALSRDLVPTVERILSICQARGERGRILRSLTRSHLSFELENDTALLPPLVALLEEMLLAQLGPEREGPIVQFGTAVSEALLNAIHHGNLELSSELREEDISRFTREARERAGRSPYRERRVRMDAWIQEERARIVVRDEGPGFDPGGLPDPLDPANLLAVSGRGLFLIRAFADEVSHNRTGNEITMIKRFDGAA
jgi:CheY-like chemotaxis protein/anti-sigma regulatory factor (Ser/Thr protein kinase)